MPDRASSLARARANKETRTKNELAHFSRAYRMPMHTTKAGRNAFAHAMRIIQARCIPEPVRFAVRAKTMAQDKPLDILTVCCGAASTEMSFFSGLAHRPRITLVDINRDLLEMAAAKLEDVADTKIICGDANEIEFPRDSYDISMCVAGLHHIVELEHLVGQLAMCLRPDGEFWSVGEYVGMNGARLWPDSYEIANGIFRSLPEKYRINNIFGKIVDENLRNVDCSINTFEGIRAEEVDEVLDDYFVKEHVDRWSTIAWRVVGPAFVDNYDLENDIDREQVEKIAHLDCELMLNWKLRTVGMKGVYKPKSHW